ncbi:MAG: LCP family protein [Cyanobacteria bacterium REEB65]|nr:LCP family protein [Cyanobacteria bacterium REEB65]
MPMRKLRPASGSRSTRVALAARVRRRQFAIFAIVALFAVLGIATVEKTLRSLSPWAGKWVFGEGQFLDRPRNLLLMGLDRAGKGAQGAMFVCLNLNPRLEQVTAISIPAETQTTMAGYGIGKLADASAGGSSVTATVSSLLGRPIDRVVTLDPDVLARMIDAAGGVTLDVPAAVRLTSSKAHDELDVRPGVQHFAGREAVLYGELRDSGDDGTRRVLRQQYLAYGLASQLARHGNRQRAVLKAMGMALGGTISAQDADAMRRFLASGPFLRFALLPGNPGFEGTWIPDPIRIAALMKRIGSKPAEHGPRRLLAEILFNPVQEQQASALATSLTDKGITVVRTAPLEESEPASIVSRTGSRRYDPVVKLLAPNAPWFLSDDLSPYSADYTLTIGPATP